MCNDACDQVVPTPVLPPPPTDKGERGGGEEDLLLLLPFLSAGIQVAGGRLDARRPAIGRLVPAVLTAIEGEVSVLLLFSVIFGRLAVVGMAGGRLGTEGGLGGNGRLLAVMLITAAGGTEGLVATGRLLAAVLIATVGAAGGRVLIGRLLAAVLSTPVSITISLSINFIRLMLGTASSSSPPPVLLPSSSCIPLTVTHPPPPPPMAPLSPPPATHPTWFLLQPIALSSTSDIPFSGPILAALLDTANGDFVE